jgi:RNA 2',3'-cyclic 3'-phosphodiesterase
MPRLFTALDVPPKVAQSLSLLRGGLSGARWIDQENYHITLRFIGDIDHDIADEIAQELRYISRSPLTLSLDELGVFGGDRPRALIARVSPDAPLMDLQAEQERIMRRVGCKPETRKFVPHVTLARLNGTTSADVAAYLSARGLFAKRSFMASRVVLMSSRQSRGGGPYIIEEEYPLARV